MVQTYILKWNHPVIITKTTNNNNNKVRLSLSTSGQKQPHSGMEPKNHPFADISFFSNMSPRVKKCADDIRQIYRKQRISTSQYLLANLSRNSTEQTSHQSPQSFQQIPEHLPQSQSQSQSQAKLSQIFEHPQQLPSNVQEIATQPFLDAIDESLQQIMQQIFQPTEQSLQFAEQQFVQPMLQSPQYRQWRYKCILQELFQRAPVNELLSIFREYNETTRQLLSLLNRMMETQSSQEQLDQKTEPQTAVHPNSQITSPTLASSVPESTNETAQIMVAGEMQQDVSRMSEAVRTLPLETTDDESDTVSEEEELVVLRNEPKSNLTIDENGSAANDHREI